MVQYFFKLPFGINGNKAAIPQPTQGDGSVSFNQGFPIDYELDPDVQPTAKDVPRDKFNQLMYLVTSALQILQVHGFPDFITTADNGGTPYLYDINSTVRFSGGWAGVGALNYYSLVDSNNTTPADATKWGLVTYQKFELPGVVKEYYGATLPTGYVWPNGTTIGSVASNATGRANADTIALYTVLWESMSNTVLPIQNSSGAATTRGASALADFNLNKRLPTPDRREYTAVGKGDMGGTADPGRITLAGSGFNPTTLGATGGVETVALTANQNGPHSHTINISDPTHTHTGSTATFPAHRHFTTSSRGEAPPSYSTVPLSTVNCPTYLNGSLSTGQYQLVAPQTQPDADIGRTSAASGGTATVDITLAATGITAASVSSGLGSAHINVQPSIVCNYILALGTA
jgi:microcystin-dependent protein